MVTGAAAARVVFPPILIAADTDPPAARLAVPRAQHHPAAVYTQLLSECCVRTTL